MILCLYHCSQPDETYRKRWELEWEAPGVTVTVINMRAMVMCEYIASMVNNSLLNRTPVRTGPGKLSRSLWFVTYGRNMTAHLCGYTCCNITTLM